ncbi:MAG: T9SS type A sorting domain-containing protein [Aureispira sp.]|nr:T9SS type A sorting domain-containing protein [Aureispira sp.]
MLKHITLLLILIITYSNLSFATDFYWKGGNGDFNDPNMWHTGSFGGPTALQAPISADNVNFTAAAFITGPDTITINTPANCHNFIFDNAITAPNAPRLVSGTGVSLDVYGSMTLAQNMDFAFNGTLRFRSIDPVVETLTTRGHKFLLIRLDFDGAAGTEFRLMDNLYVDDPNELGNTLDAQAGTIYLLSGLLNTNSKEIRTDFFISRNGNVDRGLNFSNSRIYIAGRSNVQRSWYVDFNSSTANYNSFDATGSHLLFTQTTYNSGFQMGYYMVYDSVSSQNPLLFYGTDTMSIVTLNNGGILQPHNTRITIDTLHLGGNLTFFGLSNGMVVDHIEIAPSCDFTIFTRNSYGAFIRKKNPGTLNLTNVILIDIDGDISNGSTYNAFNSIDIGTNTNWNFTNPVPRQMYFRDGGNNDWHTASNWQVWNGATFTPAGCIPSPADNVYFDNLSFPNANQFVNIDSTAYCNDMRWLNSINPNDELRVNTNDQLNMFGTLQLNNKMATVGRYGSNTIFLWGNKPDSIISDGVTFELRTIRLKRYADYHIADNFIAHNLTSEVNTMLRTDNITMDIQGSFVTSNRIMDSTYVTFYCTEYTSYANNGGSSATYTGNTTFHFINSTYGRMGNGCILPNTIVDVFKIWNSGTHEIRGDLTLNANNQFYQHPTFTSYLHVTGSMALYNGDLNIAPGTEQVIDEKVYGANNGGIEVDGTLNCIGNCTDFIILRTQTGQSTPFKAGVANIQYTLVTGMDNSGNPIVNATNSVDNGGNVNWNFAPSTGTTYYWRADANDATDFEGRWDNPDHWTSNPSDITGTLGGCTPSVEDTVIFDSQSFSVTSNGCEIPEQAFCKTLICRDNVLLDEATNYNDRLYIAESFHLAPNMTNYQYNGLLFFIGSGDIDMNGNTTQNRRTVFNNPTGVWNLLNDVDYVVNSGYGYLDLLGGTINTNGHDMNINYFRSLNSTNNRALNLGNSTINVSYTWNLRNGATFTINPGTSTINLQPYSTSTATHYMGDGLTYNDVNFIDTSHSSIAVRDSAVFRYARFYNTTYLYGSNTFDTVHFHGGTFVYLSQNTRQTLTAPYGAILIDNDAGPGNFVNIETNPTGQTSYFYKDYGQTFCVDWVKVKENEAQKGNTPPPAWTTQHPFLKFETGSNSDNVSGTATGIWEFNLPPILTVVSAHPDTVNICTGGDTTFVPLQLTGTYPYSIIYNWTDIWGASGIDTIVVTDDDNDVTTVFNYNLALHPWTTTDYTIDVAALRCGGRNYGAPIAPLTLHLGKDELVSVDRQATCNLNNNSVWTHFLDNVEQKPILSILDSVSTTDTDSLGLVQAQANFDATVEYWSGKPYLQRHWKVDANNTTTGGKVRLYFTQEELDTLSAYTPFVASLGRSLIPASELILWKFDNTITVGTPTQIPFTVIPLTGRAADPFSTTTAVLAIEFEVNNFSGFMLQPTDAAFLPIELLSFDAVANKNQTVSINWTTALEEEVEYFEVERTQDFKNIEPIAKQEAKEKQQSYKAIDETPLIGDSYYRLKIYETGKTISYSSWDAVNIVSFDDLQLSPNPATDQLQLQLKAKTNDLASITIYNSVGMEVQQEPWNLAPNNNNRKVLSLKGLSSGTYLLLIKTQNHVISKRFIVK